MQTSLLRQQVYLAALLHDIGKFYQRADDSGTAQSKLLSEQTKRLESILCPKGANGYTHKHVLWTAQFLYDFETHIRNLLLQSGVDEELTFIKLAASHHFPEAGSIPGLIIQKADHYSSGVDRTKDEGTKDEKDETSWDSFKRKRMCSVFEGLFSEKPLYDYKLPVSTLNLDKDFFPAKEFSAPPDYKALWNAFVTEFKFIQSGNFRTFAENLLKLLEKYTSTIPSSTMHLPDVSLFDHSKTTAAFAVSLFDYLDEKNGLKQFDIQPDEPAFLLIGADISGIQSFIYEIVSKNAGKNLKGRSFYLQLLVDSILQKLISELGLFNANIVYSSGGGFYLIAPNTKAIREKLKSVIDEISENIYNSHKNSLFLAFDFVEFSQDNLFGQTINIPWQRLIEKLDRKKQQRNLKQILENYDDFFEPTDFGGEQLRDTITGEEIANPQQAVFLEKETNPPSQPVHPLTWQQIELGKQLKDCDYWICSEIPVSYWKNNAYNPCNLGIYHYFLSKDQVARHREQLKASADRVRIMTINDLNFLETAITGAENIYGFNFYGGNDFPVIQKNGETVPKTFDEMAGTGDDETQMKRLGILRMDVDNLGQAFISGFTDNKKTFSRYSTLSRNLDFFFKGYLNKIWEKEKYKDYTFIIYAGGDDLFIVGKWSLLADMAADIYQAFRQWSCYNPKVGLSGGLAVVTPKFPIMKGAMLADESEKLAKKHKVEQENMVFEKNAITLFDKPLHWEHEFPVVKHYKEQLIHFMENDLPGGFIQKILSFYDNYLEQTNKSQNPRWRWMIAYDFSRMRSRLKDDNVKHFIDELKINIFTDEFQHKKLTSKYHFIELITIAARWAELERKS